MVSVALLGDPGVVAVKVALGIGAEEAHPAGAGVFDVGVQEIRRLAGAAGGGDHGVDVPALHQGLDLFPGAHAPHNEPLLLGQLSPPAPFGHLERHQRIAVLDLRLGRPSRGPMLAVPHRFGLDAVEGAVVCQDDDQGDEARESRHGKNKRGKLCHHINTIPFP